ncbi:unnamed protein product [Phytophthora fragariaefolia]|uniref:Unnamed protein product n=1 Tax=Phytophthora fragariaefolia TaxID=1490495 RepID=A0A9W6Y5U8_9STRA|nr:unnamed protein product [Phytophthora fragariaefolia]
MSDTSEFELASSPDSSSEEEGTTLPGSTIWIIDFKHMEPISVDIEALARMINYTNATGGTVMQYWHHILFGYVVLLQLARAGTAVVNESGKHKQRYLFTDEVEPAGSQNDFVQILEDPKAYCIINAVEPEYFPAKTSLLASPRHCMWYKFKKTNRRSCCMPIWSMLEFRKCRKLFYSDILIPVNVVQGCLHRWGGVVRFVLRFAQVGGQQQTLLEKAIDIVDLYWLMPACCRLHLNDDQVSDIMLHFHADERYMELRFCIATGSASYLQASARTEYAYLLVSYLSS